MKKGGSSNVLKNRPDYSALPNATENIHYSELGIRAIFCSARDVGSVYSYCVPIGEAIVSCP